MVRLRASILSSMLLVAVACDAGDTPARSAPSLRAAHEPNPGPLVAKWYDESYGSPSNLRFEGVVGQGHFEPRINGSSGELILTVRAIKVPAGTVISRGEQSAKIDNGDGTLEVKVDYPFGPVTIADANDWDRIVDLDVKFQVELPGYAPATVRLLPVKLRPTVQDLFEGVAKRAVTFIGEPADDGRRETLVQIGQTGIDEVYGSGTLLQDIDLIALEEPVKTEDHLPCGYLGGSVNFQMVHSIMRVFDRRSGELIAETTLVPTKMCPQTALAHLDGSATPFNVGQDEKRKWLRGVAKKSKRGKK